VIGGAARTLERTDAVILEYSPELSRSGGLSVEEMAERLCSHGFVPFVLCATGGTVRTDPDELRALSGSLDVIFLRAERLPEVERGMNEQPRGRLSIQEIAEQNMKIVKPL
jgi:shikimate kinase